MKIIQSQIYDRFNTNNKHNTEIFAFLAAVVLKLLIRKVFCINRKGNTNC